MNQLKKYFKKDFILFSIVAVLSMVFELALYTIFFEVFKIDKVASSPLAQVCSMIFNFTLNKTVIFKTSKEKTRKELIGYLIVWLINLFSTTVLMSLLLNAVNIYPTIIRFLVNVLMFFVNYFLLKSFVFTSKK